MRIGANRATWTRQFATDSYSTLADEDDVQRARATATDERVRMLVVSDDGATIMATIRPLLHRSVENVRLTYDGNTLVSHCSCDGSDRHDEPCIHALAALIATAEACETGGSAPAPQPDAPTLLDAKPSRALAPARASRARVGLEFSLTPDDHVEVRPVRRVGSKWLTSGNSWEAFTDPAGARWATTEQSDAIFDLYQVFLLARREVYAYGSRRVQLDGLSARVWPPLIAAHEAGVVFVPGSGLADAELTLAAEPSAPVVDLHQDDDGLDVRLAIGDHPAAGSRLIPLGDPMHGVLVLDKAGAILLPLARAAIDEVRDLAAAGRRHVPRTGIARFFSRELPRLALHVGVTSRDDTVDLPDLVRPRLAVTATSIAAAHPTVELSWRLSDPSLDDEIAAELGGDLLTGLRAAAPRRLARLLPEPGEGMDGHWRRRIVGASEVRTVATELLDFLSGHDDVEVGDVDVATPDADASVPTVAIGGRASTEAKVPTQAKGWLDLDIDVTVSGERVPFEALFAALASGAATLHLASGKWIALDHPSLYPLRTLIESARDLQTRTSSGRGQLSVSTFDIAAAQALDEIGGIDDERTVTWVERMQTLAGLSLGEADATIELPSTVHAELRDYQERGVAWATHLWRLGLGGVLADDMGLGKTLQLLAAIAIAKADGLLDAPVLVVAPTSVVGGWVEQAARFTPDLSIAPITKSASASGLDLPAVAKASDVIVTSYALARIDADELAARKFSAIIIDEAQFVKNPGSKTFRALRDIPTDLVIAVTGTPLENSLTDLWAMFALTAPGLLGTLKQFQRRFKKPIEAGAEVADERRAQLRRLVGPFLLRRTKDQVAAELPEKQDQVAMIELDTAHRRRYDEQLQLERQRVLGLLDDAEKNRVAILRSLTILRRLALDVRLSPGDDTAPATASQPSAASAKTRTLLRNLLEISAEGHRALVFSQFTSYLALVRQELEAAGIDYCYLDGATRRRAEVIERFRAGDVPVFLISLKAGGFGLNLTEADYVFLMDPWWNPAVEEQAVDRTHRIGQTRSVNVYRFVAADTIEEKVLALQERKRQLFDDVIGDGSEFGSGALTAEDVRGLLAD
ncbi:hypothetical protein BSZ39_01145 [Bowdeniella nasicola]|uniref:Superfamily II DNA or RNA helicase, SNF2 family n=1 Tax=Bowdeniella nasicola TaxID=208480 RepID=A0A1Q5Q5B6_9ACTO|nr:DEAD/DEAH box helicase [Bowdeniella nasicola]OKL55014.1 hypothetical protein BSZ39_01145 [Bowdeniella nasicola]